MNVSKKSKKKTVQDMEDHNVGSRPNKEQNVSGDKTGSKSNWSEGFAVGYANTKLPTVYRLMAIDKSEKKYFFNCFVKGEFVVVPQHAAAGSSKLFLIKGGAKYPLPGDSYKCQSMADQVWMKKPEGVKLDSIKHTFRGPNEGEHVNLVYIDEDDCVKIPGGSVANKFLLGDKRDIVAYGFTGTTLAGACGGVYVAESDGAIVGIHCIGSKTRNKFYPVNNAWKEEASTFNQGKKNYNHSDDIKYNDDYDEQIKVQYEQILSDFPPISNQSIQSPSNDDDYKEMKPISNADSKNVQKLSNFQ